MNQKDCFVKHCSIFTTKEDFLKVPMSSSTTHNYHQSFLQFFKYIILILLDNFQKFFSCGYYFNLAIIPSRITDLRIEYIFFFNSTLGFRLSFNKMRP